MAPKLPPEFKKRIESVTNKRARLVLDHIARNGSITTEELGELGYHHPPRARMDAIDLGFPMKTTKVKSRDGRKNIAAYSFNLVGKFGEKSGRVLLPKKDREAVITKAHGRCELCGGTHDLQVDHRVPYQVAGESLKGEENPYMALDGSCNRRKSWVCEHCKNFTDLKQIKTCKTCYWASPEQYTHVAMEQLRRVELVWQGDDCKSFDSLKARCKREGISIAEAIKKALSAK